MFNFHASGRHIEWHIPQQDPNSTMPADQNILVPFPCPEYCRGTARVPRSLARIELPALTPWFQSAYLRDMRRIPMPSPSGAIIILRQMEKHEWLITLPRMTEEVDDRLEEGIDGIDGDPDRAKSIFLGRSRSIRSTWTLIITLP